MMEVNLLPWREKKKRQQIKTFVYLAVSSILAAVFFIICIKFLYANTNDFEQEQIALLNIAIASVGSEITALQQTNTNNAEVLNTLQYINRLQKQRTQVATIFNKIPDLIPDGIYLTALEKRGNTVSISGLAESHKLIAVVITSINHSDTFTDPELKDISLNPKEGEKNYTTFELSMKLKSTGRQ